MEHKEIKNLSNSEIAAYKLELENLFEVTKTKINELCDEIDDIEREYNKVLNETKIRLTNIYK